MAIDIAEVAPDGRAVYVRRGRVGIDPDGGVVIGNGLAVIAARIPGVAAVLVGGRKVRRQFDRAIEVGDCMRDVAAIQEGKAAQPVGDAQGLALQPAGFKQAGASGNTLGGEVGNLGRA
jgi:hypothetical protein